MLWKVNIGLYFFLAVVLFTNIALSRQNRLLRSERNQYKGNTEALMGEMKRMQVDSCRMALDVRTVKISLEEFKRLRREDTETIRKLGIKLRDLERVAKHSVVVEVEVQTEVRDTVVLRDTAFIPMKKIELETPHISVMGLFDDREFIGNIRLPVKLHQVFWVEHKRRFLWWKWGVKAVHQTISSDNPYAEIEYSEVIEIGR